LLAAVYKAYVSKKRFRGRPAKYKKSYAKLALLACAGGVSDKELSQILGVAKSTLNRWKHERREFSDSLREGKATADATVIKALYRLAIGYEYKEIQTTYNKQKEVIHVIEIRRMIPPDLKAIHMIMQAKRAYYALL
jgi:transposase-like protein